MTAPLRLQPAERRRRPARSCGSGSRGRPSRRAASRWSPTCTAAARCRSRPCPGLPPLSRPVEVGGVGDDHPRAARTRLGQHLLETGSHVGGGQREAAPRSPRPRSGSGARHARGRDPAAGPGRRSARRRRTRRSRPRTRCRGCRQAAPGRPARRAPEAHRRAPAHGGRARRSSAPRPPPLTDRGRRMPRPPGRARPGHAGPRRRSPRPPWSRGRRSKSGPSSVPGIQSDRGEAARAHRRAVRGGVSRPPDENGRP